MDCVDDGLAKWGVLSSRRKDNKPARVSWQLLNYRRSASTPKGLGIDTPGWTCGPLLTDRWDGRD